MPEIVLLWLATTLDRFAIVEARAIRREIRVATCAPEALRDQDLRLSAGPVIAVLDDDHSAPGALGAGVDEVVRHSELTDSAIDRAIVRASARAQARHRWLVQDARVDRSGTLSCLLDWISIELANQLSGAVLEAELLEERLRRLVHARGYQAEDLESICPRGEMLEMTETVRQGFRGMNELLAAVRTLSGSEEAPGTSVQKVFAALSRILINRLVPIADLEFAADEGCVTTMSTERLVAALVMVIDEILARATRGAGAPTKNRVALALRASVVGNMIIVEVEDDIGCDADPVHHMRRPSAADLRLWLREEGGDLFVGATRHRRTTRLVLPHASSESTNDGRSERWQFSS